MSSILTHVSFFIEGKILKTESYLETSWRDLWFMARAAHDCLIILSTALALVGWLWWSDSDEMDESYCLPIIFQLATFLFWATKHPEMYAWGLRRYMSICTGLAGVSGNANYILYCFYQALKWCQQYADILVFMLAYAVPSVCHVCFAHTLSHCNSTELQAVTFSV